ncbi:hypothetical protein [Lactobacillus crispatus]|uniref:Conserved protein n=1 Tax=Lactobacillus crispatus (strain ST1) TaxID=748671 RepID=D5GZZ0_LACCS|nr:hypothetical protein [Lactobacillus crispatus]CBL51349.1 conserved protein [Lactobacillus crispatus ST1]
MNDWKLKLGNKILVENKYNTSDFVEFIKNQEQNYNFNPKNKSNNSEILEKQIKKAFCDFVKITSIIDLNFDIHLRFIKEFGMPSYLVKQRTILISNKFMFFRNSIKECNHQIFWFFIYHEFGHALLDQNAPKIYENFKVKSLFLYLCRQYESVILSIDKKELQLDINRVYKEFLPDLFSVLMLQEKFQSDLTTDWDELYNSFSYFKTNEEAIGIFTKDPHAPIEARLYISKKAIEML